MPGSAQTRSSGDRIGAASTEHVRPFVGRTRELDELGAAFADASDGHGAVLLVCGEPGIGKSRLMEVLAASARADGWSVLVGRCWDGGGAPAYWPWVQVVRAAGADFDALAPAGEEATARPPRRSSVSSAADADAERFRLFEAVGAFLGVVSSEQPVMIVLDDLHAADEPSLLLLRFLATTADTRRVLVLGSYRESEPRVLDHAELFGELTRLGRRVPLRGLSVEEVTSYLTLVGGEPTSGAIAARLQGVTGGNPFFLGEVVRVLIAEGRLGSADEAAMRRIPEEVRALIRRHVSTLSPDTIGMLRVAAVLGHDLDLRVLADAGPISADRMTDAVSEAVRSGILSEDPRRTGVVRVRARPGARDAVRRSSDHPQGGPASHGRRRLGARVPRRPRPAPGRDRASPLAGGALGRRRPGRRVLAARRRSRGRRPGVRGRGGALRTRAPAPVSVRSARRSPVGHPDAARGRAGALRRHGGGATVLRGGGGPVAPVRRPRGGGAGGARPRDERGPGPARLRWIARDDDRRSGEHRRRAAGGGAADAPAGRFLAASPDARATCRGALSVPRDGPQPRAGPRGRGHGAAAGRSGGSRRIAPRPPLGDPVARHDRGSTGQRAGDAARGHGSR